MLYYPVGAATCVRFEEGEMFESRLLISSPLAAFAWLEGDDSDDFVVKCNCTSTSILNLTLPAL